MVVKSIFILLVILFLVGCSDKDGFKNEIENNNLEHLLHQNDSIEIYADITINHFRQEKDIIKKHDNKLVITSYFKTNEDSEKWTFIGSVDYHFNDKDSLNFQNLFIRLNEKDTVIYNDRPPTFTVVYKEDSSKYYSHGLYDIIENSMYYLWIKQRIFPNDSFYIDLIKRDRIKF